MALVKHYDVTMKVEVQRFPGCCGGKIISNFEVRGSTNSLTLAQKGAMYDHLLLVIMEEAENLVVAMDCVIGLDGWEETGRDEGYGTTVWVEDSANCGDISLEDFCNHHDFVVSSECVNSNSGNVVAVMSKALRKALPNGDIERYKPDMPDFADEVVAKPKSSPSVNADTADVLARLRSLVAGE